MLRVFIGVLLCLSLAANAAAPGEATALARLSSTTGMLVDIGEEFMGEPMTGMLVLEDTVSIDLTLSPDFTYQFIMWTESTFNFVDFWVTNPQGETPRGELSDHTTFTIMPGTEETQVWKLNMELLEAASSDTAYYAVAVLRRERLSYM